MLFCHMGVTFYMLSHLLSISPVCLNHTMFLPPSSVTVVSTEEVEQGYGMFRTQMLGDTSHLYCAGEPVSHMGYFAGDSAGTSVMIGLQGTSSAQSARQPAGASSAQSARQPGGASSAQLFIRPFTLCRNQ